MAKGKPSRLPLLEQIERDIPESQRILKGTLAQHQNLDRTRDGVVEDLVRPLQTRIRTAEKVKLDPDFIRMVVNLATKAAYDLDLLERLIELSRAPFRLTWLEWDAETMFQERVKLGTMKELADDRPKHLGCFISSLNEDGSLWQGHSWSWADSDKSSPRSAPCCFRTILSTEGGLPLIASPHQLDTRENRSHVLIGATIAGTPLVMEGHPVLDHIQIDEDSFISQILDESKARRWFQTSILEMRGVLRFVVCALALMNCAVIHYRTEPVPPGRRIVGGRTVPYLAHRTVTIHVPPGTKNVTKYLVKQVTDRHHRAHMVRGHWRNGYIRTRRGKEQVVKGSWVKPHQRGDASLGFIYQDHEVRAG